MLLVSESTLDQTDSIVNDLKTTVFFFTLSWFSEQENRSREKEKKTLIIINVFEIREADKNNRHFDE
jgi:hypothetical protein